ncbi:hypothetical protein HHX47_DHR1001070, partial [Lentinula edodes]
MSIFQYLRNSVWGTLWNPVWAFLINASEVNTKRIDQKLHPASEFRYCEKLCTTYGFLARKGNFFKTQTDGREFEIHLSIAISSGDAVSSGIMHMSRGRRCYRVP